MRLEREYSTFAVDALPCAMCHGSTLLPVNENRLLCAFFGGSYEGDSDVGIYVSTLINGSYQSHCFIKQSSEAHWNPVLFRLSDSEIVLFFKVGNVIASWRTYICKSYDDGQSWSEPIELVAGDQGGRGPVRNLPLRLTDGRIICPASLEQGQWRSFVDISDDNLKTLHKSAEIYADKSVFVSSEKDKSANIEVSEQSFSGRGIIQPALWEDSHGVHMLLRSTFGTILRSDSTDRGESWCSPYAVNMPNNNSAIAVVYCRDRLYLLCNPVAGNWGVRTPLCLFSSDNGTDFTEELILENEDGEFSYPCMSEYKDSLYICYTSRRKNIRIHKYIFF
ncbi:MAG: exo-alpha-sialidase [Succinivibrio sp.]|nr:exo-alpha-sialidase [Succinivibrio sp.]